MRWILFFVALVLGTALDLGTKQAAFDALPRYAQTQPINEWFSFTHAVNRGAAFGMFQGQHDFFMLVTVVAFVAVPYFVHTSPRGSRAIPITLGLILSGVAGNFWDRIVHGHVRDFLDVHTPPTGAVHDLCMSVFGRDVWPTFNVADVFITCGAVAMVLFFGRAEQAKKSEPPAPTKGDGAPASPPPPATAQEPAPEAKADLATDAAPVAKAP